MKIVLLAIIFLGLSLAMFSQNLVKQTNPSTQLSLLPYPSSVKQSNGKLMLTSSTAISLDPASDLAGRHFATRLARGTGWNIPITSNGIIKLKVVPNKKASPESYTLKITTKGVNIRAASAQGIVRATETLLQLMPPAIYSANKFDTITLPTLTITDSPAFQWRALMLDVSRKFQNKETIIKLLDGMAACKLNLFHWHLTDDQGWRLPIEVYPKLTEEPNDSYTRDDIREVVEHAAKLGITIMPEIDMPGHSLACCKAYPEISTLDDKGNPTGTINPGSDATYRFVEDVIGDVVKQFPNSPYIHIGADEVGKKRWEKDPQCQALMDREKLKNTSELYTYFVNRATAIVKKNGRKAFAWDEAFNLNVDPDLVIMSWRGMRPGIEAAKANRAVVFCPTPQIYIDHANSRSNKNMPAYSGNTAYLNHCYFFNPGLPAVPSDKRHLVLGGEACIWSECITSADHMFMLAFPRACAIGETLWTPRQEQDWDSFLARLDAQRQRLEAMKIAYFWEPQTLAINIGSWGKGEIISKNGVLDFDLSGKFTNPGVQEFFVGQGLGEGQFLIEYMELLKDGEVISKDRHSYESSVYKDAKSLYLLKSPDITGKYTLQIHAKQLSGDCSAIVPLIPALPLDQYSKQCGPDTGANSTKEEMLNNN